MIALIVLALFVASVSFTISVTSIFSWLREGVSNIHPKLEELIHCPYCLGHYIAFIALLLTDFDKIPHLTGNVIIDFMIAWLCIMTPVALFHYVMLLAYRPVAETMSYRTWKKQQETGEDSD